VAGSTEQAAKLGDAAWRDLLDRYYYAVERELVGYGGVEVDRAGDGMLALFEHTLKGLDEPRRLFSVR